MNQEASLAIVVASCDKYSDLWEPLFGEFFKYWPDCPYPIFLVANDKVYTDPRVTTLLAGDDIDWSTTIAKALSEIKQSHVLFWIDDAFLAEKVESSKIDKYFQRMLQIQANFLRLRPNPLPAVRIDSEMGVLGKAAAYRVTLFATIWKMSALREILKPGESAWAFELQGSVRSQNMDGYYTVLKDVIGYLHGVERGVWIRDTAQQLESKGYELDYSYRSCMSKKDAFWFKYRMFKSWVFHKIPERFRGDFLRLIQRIYRLKLRGR